VAASLTKAIGALFHGNDQPLILSQDPKEKRLETSMPCRLLAEVPSPPDQPDGPEAPAKQHRDDGHSDHPRPNRAPGWDDRMVSSWKD
jgi:hypothetical protein